MNPPRAAESNRREEFRRRGFFLAREFCQISPQMSQEVSGIVERSASLERTTYVNGAKYVISNQGACCRVEWIPFEAPSVRSFFTDAGVKSAAAEVTDVSEFDLIICQFNFRRPSDNVTYGWHRDTQEDKGSFRNLNGIDNSILLSIAVTEIPLSRAPLSVLPYSHLEKNRHLIAPENEASVTTLPMRSGDALFMHPALLHSSGQNRSSLFRGLLIGLLVPSHSYRRSKSFFSQIKA